MSRKTKLWILTMFLLFTCHPAAATDIYKFQEGIDHGYGVYAGASDITIVRPGHATRPANYLRIETEYPTAKELYNTLIQFQDIDEYISGATVVKAYITFTYHDDGVWQPWVQAKIYTYPMLPRWSKENADWYYYDTDLSWDQPGAQDPNDRGDYYLETPMPERESDQLYIEGNKYKIDLPTELVQPWLDDPNFNRGVLMAMDPVAQVSVEFYSNDFEGDPNYHPLLTIEVSSCLKIPADLNYDCYVNHLDLYELYGQWLDCEGGSADIYDAGDGCVNLLDYNTLAGLWLQCSDPANSQCVWPPVVSCAPIAADLNDDCYVDHFDLYIMRSQWLDCEGGSADIYDAGDGCVNLLDFNVFAGQWLLCSDPENNLCTLKD